MNIALIMAFLLTLFVVRELWSAKAWVPWRIPRAPGTARLPTDRIVYREQQQIAYWLSIGLHTATVTVLWFYALTH